MKVVALALIAAFALSGSATAREKYRSRQAPPAHEQHSLQGLPVISLDDTASQQPKVYQWPDHRYYGRHGMMLD